MLYNELMFQNINQPPYLFNRLVIDLQVSKELTKKCVTSWMKNHAVGYETFKIIDNKKLMKGRK